jgi:hypothetical protein
MTHKNRNIRDGKSSAQNVCSYDFHLDDISDSPNSFDKLAILGDSNELIAAEDGKSSSIIVSDFFGFVAHSRFRYRSRVLPGKELKFKLIGFPSNENELHKAGERQC